MRLFLPVLAAAAALCPLSAEAAGDYAFAWANDPIASSYSPHYAYQWSSAGIEAQITRQQQGVYRVRFPGMSGPGHVQVSAYGVGPEFCNVSGWWETAGGVDAYVRCFDPQETPTDKEFSILYMRHDNDWPSFPEADDNGEQPRTMYLWADQPTASTYEPHWLYRFVSEGPVPSITRLGTGRYRVDVDPSSILWRGEALVTAYSNEAVHCAVQYGDAASYSFSYGILHNPFFNIRVDCRRPNGDYVDSRFVLTAVRDVPYIPMNEGASWAPFTYVFGEWIDYNSFDFPADPTQQSHDPVAYDSGDYSGMHLWGQASDASVALVHGLARGNDLRYCNPISWIPDDGFGLTPYNVAPPTFANTWVDIACYELDGTPVDLDLYGQHVFDFHMGAYVTGWPR